MSDLQQLQLAFFTVHHMSFFRHLRFLLRSAEEAIEKAPSLESLQNQATVTKAEVQAIRTQLADTIRQQALDHAQNAEEKDGRLNET